MLCPFPHSSQRIRALLSVGSHEGKKWSLNTHRKAGTLQIVSCIDLFLGIGDQRAGASKGLFNSGVLGCSRRVLVDMPKQWKTSISRSCWSRPSPDSITFYRQIFRRNDELGTLGRRLGSAADLCRLTVLDII